MWAKKAGQKKAPPLLGNFAHRDEQGGGKTRSSRENSEIFCAGVWLRRQNPFFIYFYG